MDTMLIPTLPCPKAWVKMSGDETTRFCSYCKKRVYNLEAMSVSERWKLLSSPAATICSRYQVAIRRPAKGKEEFYRRRLLKCGAGVALTGSVLLVLWEMHDERAERTFYRTAAGLPGVGCLIPADLYEERHYMIVDEMAIAPPHSPPTLSNQVNDKALPPHVDLDLDPVAINQLIEATRPPSLEQTPDIPLKPK